MAFHGVEVQNPRKRPEFERDPLNSGQYNARNATDWEPPEPCSAAKPLFVRYWVCGKAEWNGADVGVLVADS